MKPILPAAAVAFSMALGLFLGWLMCQPSSEERPQGPLIDTSGKVHVFRQFNQPHFVLKPFNVLVGSTSSQIESRPDNADVWVVTFQGDAGRVVLSCYEEKPE